MFLFFQVPPFLQRGSTVLSCHGKITGIVDAKKLTKEQLGLMMTGTEAGELGLDKSMASEKKEEQA